MIDNLQELLAPISKFFYIITHPKVVLTWIIDVSYWVAVIISITSLLFFIGTRSKKSKQILEGTILAYILIKAISTVL